MRTRVMLLLAQVAVAACAQMAGVGMIDDYLYDTRVKLVDEFFERFNHSVTLDADTATREQALLPLFNAAMATSVQDEAFVRAKGLCARAVADSVVLHYSDSTWLARAVCQGRLRGKEVEFTLYLNVENRREDMYKWVIAKAEGDIFRLTPSLTKETIMLMPDDHETNFMSLRRITDEKDDYILNYKQRTYEPDMTSVFYAMVYCGLLDIDWVTKLDFVFLQVPGYEFMVSRFDRESSNAGWLIGNVRESTDEEKAKFLNYIYNKR